MTTLKQSHCVGTCTCLPLGKKVMVSLVCENCGEPVSEQVASPRETQKVVNGLSGLWLQHTRSKSPVDNLKS